MEDRIEYRFDDWVAVIKKHPRRDEWSWSVSDVNGNDTYDFHSNQDVVNNTSSEAERDMFNEMESRIGYAPDSKCE